MHCILCATLILCNRTVVATYMIPIEKAEALIRDHLPSYPLEQVPLEKVHGRILMEEVLTDRPQPPFDRVAIDGIAMSSNALHAPDPLTIESTQALGEPPMVLNNPEGACIQVITGSMVPHGCDCVVPFESLSLTPSTAKVVAPKAFQAGSNITPSGSERKRGEILLRPHTRICAHHVAIMASVGKTEVQVAAQPRIAVVSCGDEWVELDVKPQPHQGRSASTFALMAGLKKQGFTAERFHFPEQSQDVQRGLRALLEQFDLVLYNRGNFALGQDLVVQALRTLQLEPLFQDVQQRPGKSLRAYSTPKNQMVICFPANPMSTLINLHRLILPLLLQSLGHPFVAAESAILQESLECHADLTYFMPVRTMTDTTGQRKVWPVKNPLACDFTALADSDGFIELRRRESLFPAGTIVPFYAWHC